MIGTLYTLFLRLRQNVTSDLLYNYYRFSVSYDGLRNVTYARLIFFSYGFLTYTLGTPLCGASLLGRVGPFGHGSVIALPYILLVLINPVLYTFVLVFCSVLRTLFLSYFIIQLFSIPAAPSFSFLENGIPRRSSYSILFPFIIAEIVFLFFHVVRILGYSITFFFTIILNLL